jgi:hypothetical protein
MKTGGNYYLAKIFGAQLLLGTKKNDYPPHAAFISAALIALSCTQKFRHSTATPPCAHLHIPPPLLPLPAASAAALTSKKLNPPPAPV